MAENATYITKNELPGLRELEADGRSLLNSYETLSTALASRLGRAAAALFAEPVVTRGNGAVATSVAWYGSGTGPAEPVRLKALDPSERLPIETDFRARLADVATLLGDPEIGPLLGGAFFIASSDDIWVIGDRALITNWGLAPETALRSAAARDAHVDRTLGAYVSLGGAPAVGLTAWRERYQGGPGRPAVGAPATAAGAALTAAAATAGDGGEPPPPPGRDPATQAEAPRRLWIGLVIATVLAAVALIYVQIPGVLTYPQTASASIAALSQDEALNLQREINRSLDERRLLLERELSERDCTAPGALVPAPAAPGTPAEPQGISPQAAVPPRPQDLVVPEAPTDDDADASAPQRLEPVLDATTVLIIVPVGDGAEIGSGFFVAPGTIVTNRHVVETREDLVLVTNPGLGQVITAEVVAETPTSDTGSPDFAVLRVDTGDFQPPALPVSTEINRLDNVVASGFPGIVVRSDARFQALVNGDGTAAPSANMQTGSVTVIQPFAAGGSEVVLHSAEISGGNSGGPLVDTCGRVVAVNAFVTAEQEGSFRRLNYALHGRELIAFLDEVGAPYTRADGVCAPQVAPPPVAQAQP